MRFRFLTGDVNWLEYGGKFISEDDDELPPDKQQQLQHDRIIDDVESAESEWLTAYFGVAY